MKPPRHRPPGAAKTLRYLREHLSQFSNLEDFTIHCRSLHATATFRTMSCSLPLDAKALVVEEIQEAMGAIKDGKCPELQDVQVRVRGTILVLWRTLQEDGFREPEFGMQVLQGLERNIGYISELYNGNLNVIGTAALLAIWELKAYLRTVGTFSVEMILVLINKLADGKFFILPEQEEGPSFSLELDLNVLVAPLSEEQATKSTNLISEILRNDGYECHVEFLRFVSEAKRKAAMRRPLHRLKNLLWRGCHSAPNADVV